MRSIPVTPVETDQHLTNITHMVVRTDIIMNPTVCHHVNNMTITVDHGTIERDPQIPVALVINHQVVVVALAAQQVATTIVVVMDTLEVPHLDLPPQVPPLLHNHPMEGLSTTTNIIHIMIVMGVIEQNMKEARKILGALAQALVQAMVALVYSWVEVVYLWLRICMAGLSHLYHIIKAQEMKSLVSIIAIIYD